MSKKDKKNRNTKNKTAKEIDAEVEKDEEYYEGSIYKLKKLLIAQGIIFVLVAAVYIVLLSFTVTNVYVEGNQHYDAAEIRRIVENSWYGDNSIFLFLKYRGRSITDIPFIEKMDVDVVDRNTVRITVYEKKLAGYVDYLGCYEYFDKDGIVVESSNIKTEGVPLVTGLSFDHFIMYEPLPVKDDSVFHLILNITNLLNKFNIITDKIYFDKNKKITLYFGDVRVGLGTEALLEEKIQRLDAILPQLEGKSGYLEMGSYDKGNQNFTFTSD